MPSTTLIDILRRRLLDPSIVPAFERRRANKLTGGLVRPRWVLIPASEGSDAAAAASALDGDDDGCSGVKKAATSQHDTSISDALDNAMGNNALANGYYDNITPSTKSKDDDNLRKYNVVPKRNYIDLRMEQNRMFANDQSLKCQRILSTLKALEEPDPSNKDNKKWQKHADSLQSLVNEGLAACPNHPGLLGVERDYKGWLQRRMDLLVAGTGISATAKSTPATVTKIPERPSCSTSNPKKGADGRAHAAMRDALAERSFLLHGGDPTTVGGGGRRNGDSEGEDMKYPLLPFSGVDDEGLGEVDIYDGAGGGSVGRRDREKRRNRSKSKDHKKHHRSGEKRKNSRSNNHGKRRRRRDERRRSRSIDSGGSRSRSISSSSSRSSSSSYSRRRYKEKRRRGSKKKKTKRHRRQRGSHHGNGYDSEEVEEDDVNNTQLGGKTSTERDKER
jgi:hypothetical protein